MAVFVPSLVVLIGLEIDFGGARYLIGLLVLFVCRVVEGTTCFKGVVDLFTDLEGCVKFMLKSSSLGTTWCLAVVKWLEIAGCFILILFLNLIIDLTKTLISII